MVVILPMILSRRAMRARGAMPTIELLGGKEVGPAKKRSAWRIAQKRALAEAQ